MAKIANPRKQFQFNISVPGLNPWLAQKVRLPDLEIDMVEHGDTNFIVKTAGIKKTGTLNIEKISPADGIDSYVWDWMRQIQDTDFGGGDLPSNYKVDLIVEQYSNDGVTVIGRWLLIGCWPQKVNGIEYDRTGSNNTVESIDFCVDRMELA